MWAAHQPTFIKTYSSRVLGTDSSAPWSRRRAGLWLLDVSNLLVLCTLAQVHLGQLPEQQAWAQSHLPDACCRRGGRALAEEGKEPRPSNRTPVGLQEPCLVLFRESS